MGSGLLHDSACSDKWENLGLNPSLLPDSQLSSWLGSWTDLASPLSGLLLWVDCLATWPYLSYPYTGIYLWSPRMAVRTNGKCSQVRGIAAPDFLHLPLGQDSPPRWQLHDEPHKVAHLIYHIQWNTQIEALDFLYKNKILPQPNNLEVFRAHCKEILPKKVIKLFGREAEKKKKKKPCGFKPAYNPGIAFPLIPVVLCN